MYPVSKKFWASSDAYFARAANADRGRGAAIFRDWQKTSRVPDKSKRFRVMTTRISRIPDTARQATAIRVDPNFRGRVLDAIQMTAPAVTARIDEHLGALAQNAFDRWPVKTGFSKAMVFLEYKVPGPDKLVTSIGCGAWYAFYIKARKLNRKQPWRELILKPVDQALLDVSKDIAVDLESAMEGGGGGSGR